MPDHTNRSNYQNALSRPAIATPKIGQDKDGHLTNMQPMVHVSDGQAIRKGSPQRERQPSLWDRPLTR